MINFRKNKPAHSLWREEEEALIAGSGWFLDINFIYLDGANWLTFFCQPVRSWNGLILRKPIDMEKRELIQNQEATLLDLRSYLFSRQCTLLIFLQRPWEVSQRALELLHNCVQELKLLEVSQCNIFHYVNDFIQWWSNKTFEARCRWPKYSKHWLWVIKMLV